jgi:hypothetical protein
MMGAYINTTMVNVIMVNIFLDYQAPSNHNRLTPGTHALTLFKDSIECYDYNDCWIDDSAEGT